MSTPFVGHPEDRFCRVEVHIEVCGLVRTNCTIRDSISSQSILLLLSSKLRVRLRTVYRFLKGSQLMLFQSYNLRIFRIMRIRHQETIMTVYAARINSRQQDIICRFTCKLASHRPKSVFLSWTTSKHDIHASPKVNERLVRHLITIQRMLNEFRLAHARIQRGRGLGPRPLKNHKNIGFPTNTGPDPLKNR